MRTINSALLGLLLLSTGCLAVGDRPSPFTGTITFDDTDTLDDTEDPVTDTEDPGTEDDTGLGDTGFETPDDTDDEPAGTPDDPIIVGPADVDNDGDGWSEDDGDCDDSNPSAFPQVNDPPDPSDIDHNCDGVDGVDYDQDGIARETWTGDDEDCDDNDPGIPTTEIPYNGIDEDCNGNGNDEDLDGDGFLYNSLLSLYPPPIGVPDDCDDLDPNVHPAAIEDNSNGIDDNCNGQVDEFSVFLNTSACPTTTNPSSVVVNASIYDTPYNGDGKVHYIAPGAVYSNTAPLMLSEFNADCDVDQGLWYWKKGSTCIAWGVRESQMVLSGCTNLYWEDLSF